MRYVQRMSIFVVMLMVIVANTQVQAQPDYTLDFEKYANGDGISVPTDDTDVGLGVTIDPPVIVGRCGLPAPDGIRCGETPATNVANSGTNVIQTQFITEFESEVFQASFDTPQTEVSAFVKYSLGATTNAVTATIEGFNSTGVSLGSNTVTIDKVSGTDETDWTEIAFSRIEGDITRVIITSGQDGAALTNFILIDDLRFERTTTGADDTTPPTVQITTPSVDGVVFSESPINISVRVTEETNLASVVAQVTEDATGDPPSGAGFSGSISCDIRFSNPCPTGPVVYEGDGTWGFSSDVPNGDYTLTVTACDVADNCADATRSLTVDREIPPEPVEVLTEFIEVNQAVQEGLWRTQGGFDITDPPCCSPMIAGRDTLIRFYMLGNGGARLGYSNRLDIVITNRDGTTTNLSYSPNVDGTATVDIPADPGGASSPGNPRYDLFTEMRADITRTLNFVIPAEELADAANLAFSLRNETTPPTGTLRMDLEPPVDLALNVVMMTPTLTANQAVDRMVPYLLGAMPVSSVNILRTDLFLTVILPPDADRPQCRQYNAVQSAFGNGNTPAFFTSDNAYWTVTLGILANGAGGCTNRRDPNNNDDRERKTASTESTGSVAAHEIGHVMSLPHAGDANGECGGGSCEREFPNPRGTLSTGPGFPLSADFGVIFTSTTSTTPGGDPVYEIYVVDPCPVADVADRNPCTASFDSRPFDFMSYGGGVRPAGWPSQVISRGHQWVSSVNYDRLYDAIQNRQQGPFFFNDIDGSTLPRIVIPSDNGDHTGEALMIHGEILDSGVINFYPTQRRHVNGTITPNMEGEYTLELVNAGGEVLGSYPFDTVDDTDGVAGFSTFMEFVPYVNSVKSIRVLRDGTLLAETAPATNPPSVEITNVSGGERLTGNTLIQWDASDPEGEPLSYVLEYSPDGGENWLVIALIGPDEPLDEDITGIEVDFSRLPASEQGALRIGATDGLNSAVNVVNETFCVGGSGDCTAEAVAEGEASVIIEQSNGTTQVSEETPTSTDTLTITLGARPSAEVTVELVYDESQIVVSPNTLTFPANADTEEERTASVEITAVEDGTDEADPHTTSISLNLTTNDSDYANYVTYVDGVEQDTVTVSIQDVQTAETTPTAEPTISPDACEGVTQAICRLAPADGGTIASTDDYLSRFQWRANGAEWYRVWISTPDYSTFVFDDWFAASEVCDASGLCTMNRDVWIVGSGEFEWWMTYWSDGDGSAFMDRWEGSSFSIEFDAPASLEDLTATANVNSGGVTVQWDAAPDALWYNVWVGPDDFSGNIFFDWQNAAEICTSGTCTIEIAGTPPAGDYQVWLQAWNPVGITRWTKMSEFSVMP